MRLLEFLTHIQETQVVPYPQERLKKFPGVITFAGEYHPSQAIAYPNMIDIHPDAQRQGVGRALIQDFEKWARAQGATRIESGNGAWKSAIPFWKALGYKVLNIRDQHGRYPFYKRLISDGIFEAVEAHGLALWAYAAVVAEVYQAAPVSDPAARPAYDALVQSNAKLLQRLQATTDVEFTQDDPYEGPEAVAQDIVQNRRLKVFTGGGDHPEMDERENTIFRTVHDYFAHTGPNRRNVGSTFRTHNFTYRGELNAYLTHTKLAPKVAIPALFTEVVGQASYFLIMNDFPVQKATVLRGLDYINIGRMAPQLQARYRQIMQQLQSDQEYVELKLPGAQKYPKSRINRDLLSTSSRAGVKEIDEFLAF